MTATAKRVKTKFLTANIDPLVHATVADISDDWVVQRDITIIGLQVWIDVNVTAAALGENGGYLAVASITQAATIHQDSELANATLRDRWLLAATNGGEQTMSESFMWPEGYGKDIDDGEVISLIAHAMSGQDLDDTLSFLGRAIIHYVDR